MRGRKIREREKEKNKIERERYSVRTTSQRRDGDRGVCDWTGFISLSAKLIIKIISASHLRHTGF